MATIVRLHTILGFKATIDPTWDYVPITIWTEIELSCYFACLSLPAIRMLLRHILPDDFFSSVISRYRSCVATIPYIGVKNMKPQSTPNSRGFRSWMQISSDHDQGIGHLSEMDVLSKAAIEKPSAKSCREEAQVKKVDNPDIEEAILSTL